MDFLIFKIKIEKIPHHGTYKKIQVKSNVKMQKSKCLIHP